MLCLESFKKSNETRTKTRGTNRRDFPWDASAVESTWSGVDLMLTLSVDAETFSRLDKIHCLSKVFLHIRNSLWNTLTHTGGCWRCCWVGGAGRRGHHGAVTWLLSPIIGKSWAVIFSFHWLLKKRRKKAYGPHPEKRLVQSVNQLIFRCFFFHWSLLTWWMSVTWLSPGMITFKSFIFLFENYLASNHNAPFSVVSELLTWPGTSRLLTFKT